jgi:hypothetical protein
MKNLHEGLKTHSPKAVDKSMGLPKSPSVNSESTRESVAKNPKTLGPREA